MRSRVEQVARAVAHAAGPGYSRAGDHAVAKLRLVGLPFPAPSAIANAGCCVHATFGHLQVTASCARSAHLRLRAMFMGKRVKAGRKN